MIETGVGETGTPREFREDQSKAPEAPETGRKRRVTEEEIMWSHQILDPKVSILLYIQPILAKCLLL